jgi:hypothetical protein
MRIPTERELRAGQAAQTTLEQEASAMRSAVIMGLREERLRIEQFIWRSGSTKNAISGAIVDAIATGLEIGIHIGEARARRGKP